MASQRQSRRKRQIFSAVLHFQADLTVQAFSTVVSALVATFKPAKIRLGSTRYPKKHYCCPRKIVHHLLLLFSFSASLALKWLMLASCYGRKHHTYSLCECKCTFDCQKTLLHASFFDIEDLCALQNTILYHSILSGHAHINCNRMLELLLSLLTKFLLLLTLQSTAYSYCSALHYTPKIVDLLWLYDGRTRILHRSIVSAVLLSYTGDLFFPLLSVFSSCSSFIMYNIHFAFIN